MAWGAPSGAPRCGGTGRDTDQPAPASALPERLSNRQIESDPTIRHELVGRVRREIAAGDYDTPERWEEALDRLLDRLYSD